MAHEKYSAAQFACQYGRTGKPYFREFIKNVEQQNIASRSELRALIEGGDLRLKNNDKIKLKLPIFTAFGGFIFIIFTAIAIVLFSFLIIASPATFPYKVTLLLIFNGLLFGNVYVFRRYTILPYKIARKLKPVLEEFMLNWKSVNQNVLNLIHFN